MADLAPITLIDSETLARQLGYASSNAAFRDWCCAMRITPVPGRRGIYDPVLVRRRLDEAQGLLQKTQGDTVEDDPITARRARKAANAPRQS